MSDTDRWLLPAGIEEVLPSEAERLETLRRTLIDLFRSWGYEMVIPPLIEYLESLLAGTGPDLDLQTFKLIDQLSGRLMGVRADMTPQVARIDAHHLKREGPVRLCYIGTVLHTRPGGFAGSRSPIQVGAELYGHAGVESDCEVLRLMLEALRLTGVRDVHLDVGHVGIFRALARDAGLSEDQELSLFDALQRKARAEVRALLEEFRVARSLRDKLIALVDLNGRVDVLKEANGVLGGANEAARDALQTLERLAEVMKRRAPEVSLHFDLAEVRGYRYEQGVVFAAFAAGHGQEIARGGRYDYVGKMYGRVRPATGFSTDLKTLAQLGHVTGGGMRGVLAPCSDDPGLQAKVRELRAAGQPVLEELPGQSAGARQMRCDGILRLENGTWRVVPVEDDE